MKIVKLTEVIETVKKGMADSMSDEQIGHINDMLTEATYQYNAEGGKNYFTICEKDIPGGKGFPLQLLSTMLAGAGWKSTYKYDIRDGSWVHIDLPRVMK
jgi:hypothetical protein